MGKVDPHGRADMARCGGQQARGPRLSGEILNARQQDQRQLLSFLFDAADQIFGSQAPFAGTRPDLDQMLCGIQAMKCELRATAYRSEGKADFSISSRLRSRVGPEKTHHHQVQIHRQRIHRHHFGWMGAGQALRGARQRARGS